MASDIIQLKGFIEAELRNAYTNEVIRREKSNLITLAGRRWVLQQIASSDHNTAQSISHMAVGTGTVSPATSDSGLGSESLRKQIGTFSTANLTANPPSWQAAVSFATNEANTTLAEVGLFNSSAAGTILGRATFTTLNKSTSNTLSISYTISN
jgi:hypothetical protein